MQFVGRFRELEPEHADAPLLVSLRGQLDDQNAKQIVEHLQRGVGVWDVMEAVLDPLDGTTVISGGSSLLTDGEWVWREDLAYFVQKYRIGLPDAFITHVTASAGHPGASIVDVSSCMDEVLRTAGWRA